MTKPKDLKRHPSPGAGDEWFGGGRTQHEEGPFQPRREDRQPSDSCQRFSQLLTIIGEIDEAFIHPRLINEGVAANLLKVANGRVKASGSSKKDSEDSIFMALSTYGGCDEWWEGDMSRGSAEEIAIEAWERRGYPEDDKPLVSEYRLVAVHEVDVS